MGLDPDDLEFTLTVVRQYIRATNDLRGYRVADQLQRLQISANGNAETAAVHAGFVTTAEAARTLGCSERRVRQLAPSIGGIKSGGRWLVPIDSLPTNEE